MSHKGDWSRVKNHEAYQDNYDHIFRRTLRHNGVGEGDMYSDEELKNELCSENKQTTTTTTMPLDEDLRRYTAPPDTLPDEPRYATCTILAYVESWMPGYTADSYTIEEVAEILNSAFDNLLDDDFGIDTID